MAKRSHWLTYVPLIFFLSYSQTFLFCYLLNSIRAIVFIRMYCVMENDNKSREDVHRLICADQVFRILRTKSINHQRHCEILVNLVHHKLSMYRKVIRLLKVWYKHLFIMSYCMCQRICMLTCARYLSFLCKHIPRISYMCVTDVSVCFTFRPNGLHKCAGRRHTSADIQILQRRYGDYRRRSFQILNRWRIEYHHFVHAQS